MGKQADVRGEGSFDELVRLLHLANEVTIGDIAKELRLSKATAKRMISRWIAEGKVIRIGQGPATRYCLKR